MFQRIKDEKPEVLDKIVPVFGDITQVNLGLNEEHMRMVLEESELVFHMAASLKLEATLKANIEMNLIGTQHVIELCKRMPKLQLLMHLSTAFCTSDETGVLYERVYDWKDDPKEMIRCARWMDEKTMAGLESRILHPHPNTYTYTKRLAELLVRSECQNIPVCIVRPSIGKSTFTFLLNYCIMGL
jgi:fatty acyl-CoA reductase